MVGGIVANHECLHAGVGRLLRHHAHGRVDAFRADTGRQRFSFRAGDRADHRTDNRAE